MADLEVDLGLLERTAGSLSTLIELSATGRADVVKIPSGSAVRHRYTEPGMSKLDYFLPVPGRTGLLTLAFATPVEPLAEPFALLFDAIAESLRWQT